MGNTYKKGQRLAHLSFQEIVEGDKMGEKRNSRKKLKAGSWALMLAVIVNVIDVLSFIVVPQFFGLLFIMLKGIHVIFLILAVIGFGIMGLINKDTAKSVAAIILGILALWPFVTYDLISVFFFDKPLFVL